MNQLIATDFHIDEKNLEECREVLQELIHAKKEHKVGKVILAGDSFDVIKPGSKELSLFAWFLKELECEVVILAAQSHESTTPEESILNHFAILKPNITIVKEYIDRDLFVGHFIVNESKKNMGGTVSKSELVKYKYVILGHGHSYEEILPNIRQLGSARFVDFGEAKDKAKVYCLVENRHEENEKWHFIKFTSIIPMLDIELHKNTYIFTYSAALNEPKSKKEPIFQGESASNPAQNWANCRKYLSSIPEKTKVRLVFKDFDVYKEALNDLGGLNTRFYLFKEKKDFLASGQLPIIKGAEKKDVKASLNQYLEDKKVPEEIKSILKEEIK